MEYNRISSGKGRLPSKTKGPTNGVPALTGATSRFCDSLNIVYITKKVLDCAKIESTSKWIQRSNGHGSNRE